MESPKLPDERVGFRLQSFKALVFRIPAFLCVSFAAPAQAGNTAEPVLPEVVITTDEEDNQNLDARIEPLGTTFLTQKDITIAH